MGPVAGRGMVPGRYEVKTMASGGEVPIDVYIRNRLKEGVPAADLLNNLATAYDRAYVEAKVTAALRDMRRRWRAGGVRGVVWGGLWTALVVGCAVGYNLWGGSWFDHNEREWYGMLALIAGILFALSGIGSAISFLIGVVRLVGSVGPVYSMWVRAERWDGRISADPGSHRYPSRDRGEPW